MASLAKYADTEDKVHYFGLEQAVDAKNDEDGMLSQATQIDVLFAVSGCDTPERLLLALWAFGRVR